MIQYAHTPDDDQLTDEGIRSIRETLIVRYRHRVINRDDLESLVDEAIARSIAGYDPGRVPNTRMGACVFYLADLRIRDLLRIEYRWNTIRKCEKFYATTRCDYGQAEVDVQDIIDQFTPINRAIIKMRMAGLFQKDIGKALGVTHQRVSQRLSRIRDVLAGRMPLEVASWEKRQSAGEAVGKE